MKTLSHLVIFTISKAPIIVIEIVDKAKTKMTHPSRRKPVEAFRTIFFKVEFNVELLDARTTPVFWKLVGRDGVEYTDDNGNGGTSKKSVTISRRA